MSNTLIIDGKDNHEDEDGVMTIHPSHISLIRNFEQKSFDKCKILNCPVEYLTPKGFFGIFRVLKDGAECEIIIDQPITVMQTLDAGEVEGNAKLGGFRDFVTESCEYLYKDKGFEKNMPTIKLIMKKPVKQ